MELTCRTIGGNVAAALQRPRDAPIEQLPKAILEAVESSGFDCSIKPLRVWNLRLSQPGQHEMLALDAESPSLAQQLCLTVSSEGAAQR